jgi:hypothetical protein
MKMPIIGGNAVTLASGPWLPHAIAIDSTRVYWTHGMAPPPDSGVSSVPINGGNATDLHSGDVSDIFDLAVDTVNVYWCRFGSPDGDGTIWRLPKDGGGTPTLVAIGAQSATIYHIALDDMNVYWTDNTHQEVMKIAKP